MTAHSVVCDSPAQIRAFLVTVSHPDPNLDDTDLPPWFETGLTCRVNHAIYRYFREIAMPKVQGESWFIAGRNAGPLRLFWESGDDCFARELTNEETRRFGELTGVSIVRWLPSGIQPSGSRTESLSHESHME